MSSDMMTVREAAELWQISVRRTQELCRQGRVPGAALFGKSWMIPRNAPRPEDGRKGGLSKAAKAPVLLPRTSPNLVMTDLYHTPGCGDESSMALSDHPTAKLLFDSNLAFCRGDIDRSYRLARKLLDPNNSFYTLVGAIMQLSLVAIWRGDKELWDESLKYLGLLPCETETEQEILSLTLAAIDCSAMHYTGYPLWFERGNFELLPADSHPTAKVFFSDFLYLAAYSVASRKQKLEGIEGLGLMRIVPIMLEPLITQAVVDKTVIPEICLRLMAATAYQNAGWKDLAVEHVDKAIALALPDRLYGLFAIYWRLLDKLLEARLRVIAPKAVKPVVELQRAYFSGQSRLSGILQNRQIASHLSAREWEIAKWASFGLSNKAIAARLEIGESTVKSTVQSIMLKTGITDRSDFVLIL